ERVGELAGDTKALSEGRRAAAARLAGEVETALAALEMPRARLSIGLEPALRLDRLPLGPPGAEQVALLFGPDPRESRRPLRRVASGGELSRVFLALKNALRGSEAGMVLVFDEVDAGIGGRTADRVGAVLAELAADHQVLCITHLPQIAALAATHLRVAKTAREGRAGAAVARLDGAQRVEELARMAGGAAVTETTRRHAPELLRGGRRRRPADPQPA